ncbi:hypothetical protein EVA_09500 [gut metagenome]|uniref:Uncharacterized protein n=1 Tax=gut metagenome TaxID=749906 RepID=J9G695_9ZZZZ
MVQPSATIEDIAIPNKVLTAYFFLHFIFLAHHIERGIEVHLRFFAVYREIDTARLGDGLSATISLHLAPATTVGGLIVFAHVVGDAVNAQVRMISETQGEEPAEIDVFPVRMGSATSTYLHIRNPRLRIDFLEFHIHREIRVSESSQGVLFIFEIPADVMVHLNFTHRIIRQVFQCHHHVAIEEVATIHQQTVDKLTVNRNAPIIVQLRTWQIANQIFKHGSRRELQVRHIVFQCITLYHHLQS